MRRRRTVVRVLAALALSVVPGCWEPKLLDSVVGVQAGPPCPGYRFMLEGKRGTLELSVYAVNEHGRTTEKLWRVRGRHGFRRLASVCYGLVPEGFVQTLPPAGEPKPLGPGLYVAVSLTNPTPFWDYYYFRIDEQRRVLILKEDPGKFQGIVFTKDGSP